MKLKVGDKLLCKKKISDIFRAKFHIGEYYEIVEIKFELVKIMSEDESFNFFISEDYQIWNHFYTPKEVRKLKLKKINESR